MSMYTGPGSPFHGLSGEEIERRLEEMRAEDRVAQRRGRRIVVRPPFLWTLCRVTRNGDGLPGFGARPWLPASVVDLIDAHVWAACVMDQCERAVARGPLAVAKRPLDALRRLTSGDLPTAVFDATGSPKSMAAAFDYPAHGGRVVFVGLFQGDVAFNDPNFHRRELTLLASRNALPEDFGRIIRLIEARRIDTAPWITHRAPLEVL